MDLDSLPLVVPVRFTGGGIMMQSTTSRLGTTCCFVRAIISPKEGARVGLILTLPEVERPIEVGAEVGERVAAGTRGKEAGFWALFRDVAGERELKEFIDARRAPSAPPPVSRPPPPSRPPPSPERAAVKPRVADSEPPESRRSFARVATRLQIGWSSAKEFLVAYSENISRGGIFIATPNPPALREMVELLLELPDGGGPARTHAEVVQRLTADEAKALNRVPGAGLQFVGGDDEFRRRLDACIEHLLSAT